MNATTAGSQKRLRESSYFNLVFNLVDPFLRIKNINPSSILILILFHDGNRWKHSFIALCTTLVFESLILVSEHRIIMLELS